MIVQCPACQSRYRISDSRIPAKGGNLKCPSCSHTFFVAGPQAAAGAGAVPAAGQPAPTSDAGKPKEALDEVAKALLDQLDDDDWLGGGTSPTPAAAAPAPAPAAPALEPEPAPSSTEPAEPEGPTLSDTARSKLAESLGDNLDDELASVLAAAAGAADGGADSDAPKTARSASAGTEDGEETWKVRSNMGLVFDFPDLKALRKWLGTRDSHEGMTISRDGGLSWNTVADTEGVSDIRPSIVRAGLSASAGLGRRTGDSPAIQDAETRRAPAGGRATALSGSSRHVDIPISTSEGQAAKRSAIWFVLLVIVIAAAGGLHFTGIVEIPGIPAPVQRSTPPPAPTPAPVVEGEPEEASDDEGDPAREAVEEAAHRVSMGEIYDATMDRARRLLREEDFDGAMRTAVEAQQLLPLRPDAFCLAADIAAAADHEEEQVEQARATCEQKRAEAEARAAQAESAEETEGDQAEGDE